MDGLKTILITGASGYLGGRLLRKFVAEGHRVIIIKRAGSSLSAISDLLDLIKVYDIEDTGILFNEHQIDMIIHTATDYGRNGSGLQAVYEANFHFPLRLLQYALDFKVQTFVNTDTSLPANINYYSFSKKQFAELLAFSSGKLQVVNVLPEYFYGPGDAQSKFVTFVVSKMISDSSKIELSEGTQVRDFIHIDDVVSAYLSLISNLDKLPGYIDVPVGSGSGISLKELVGKIKTLSENTKIYLDFGAIPTRDNEVKSSVADNSFLRSLGWGLSVSLDEGLMEVINDQRSDKTLKYIS